MRIVLTFDSFEEFQEQVGRYAAKLKPVKPAAVPLEDVAAVLKAEVDKKPAEKKEAPAKKTEEPAAAAPEVDEKYRIEVRKVLAELNKKTGENTASKLIKDLGKDKLTDVALSDLPALMAKAKEQLDA
jgi:hypothetical protein